MRDKDFCATKAMVAGGKRVPINGLAGRGYMGKHASNTFIMSAMKLNPQH
jgi:hypothetical protein